MEKGDVEVNGAPTLRDYQTAILNRLRLELVMGKKAPLVQLATGLGKTRIGVEAAYGHVQKGGMVLWVAPRRELLAQAARALVERGCVLETSTRVRSIQELTQARALVPPASLIILDEARHYLADQWRKLRDALPEAILLGLDATPERGDGLGLGEMFDAMVSGPSVGEAVDAGWLVPCHTLRPDRPLGSSELARDPVDVILERAREESTVLFAASIDLANEYARRLRELCISAQVVWGDMNPELRDDVLKSYEDGDTKVLVNVQLLTEGWDSPRTSCVVLARGFGTAGALFQAVGRGMRPWEGGKRQLLLIDLVGATHTHGEPHEPHTWHLDGKACRKDKADVSIRFCPLCGAPAPAGEPCPLCAYEGEMKKRKPRVLGLPVDRFARERAQPEEKQIAALAGYMRAGAAKGYRAGWAIRCWEHKYGRRVTPEMKRDALRVVSGKKTGGAR